MADITETSKAINAIKDESIADIVTLSRMRSASKDANLKIRAIKKERNEDTNKAGVAGPNGTSKKIAYKSVIDIK